MIDAFLLYALLGVALFSVGLHGLVARPHLLRKLLALNVMGSGVFLFLVAAAYRNRDAGAGPDPVPHAMVLTGIVVAVSATAFALALLRRIHALTGRASLDDDEEQAG